MVTTTPYIPEYITVHLGAPSSYAQNVTVSFPNYFGYNTCRPGGLCTSSDPGDRTEKNTERGFTGFERDFFRCG